MKTILRNWNIMRGLRLLLGIIAVAQAFIQRDIVVGVFGGFLLATALANIGCCGYNSCALNYTKPNNKKDLTYEELDYKK